MDLADRHHPEGSVPAPDCLVDVDSRGGAAVYQIYGELDCATAGYVRRELATSEGLPYVAIDLSEVSFIDSAGIGVLAGAVRRIDEAGGKVGLASPGAPIARALRTAGLYHLVFVGDTVSEVLGWLGSGGAPIQNTA